MLCGHCEIGPNEVLDQSKARMSLPSSPPPDRKSAAFWTLSAAATTEGLEGSELDIRQKRNL